MLKMIDELAPGVFEPETITLLVAAFDDAWARVLRSGITFATDREKERMRETIARRIILLARNGERNSRHLRDDALLHVRN
jgi:hypothetical protein